VTSWEWRERQRKKLFLWGQLAANILLARPYKKTSLRRAAVDFLLVLKPAWWGDLAVGLLGHVVNPALWFPFALQDLQ